jgi:hypothetical protein
MLKEMIVAIDESRVRDAELRADWARTDNYKRESSMLDIIREAANKSSEQTEYAKECVKLIEARMTGQMTKSDFDQNCNLLEGTLQNFCTKCRNSGFCFTTDENRLYRCSCLRGQRINERAYLAPRRDGSKEFIMIPTIK